MPDGGWGYIMLGGVRVRLRKGAELRLGKGVGLSKVK